MPRKTWKTGENQPLSLFIMPIFPHLQMRSFAVLLNKHCCFLKCFITILARNKFILHGYQIIPSRQTSILSSGESVSPHFSRTMHTQGMHILPWDETVKALKLRRKQYGSLLFVSNRVFSLSLKKHSKVNCKTATK